MLRFVTFPTPMFLWDEDEVADVVSAILGVVEQAALKKRKLTLGFDTETTGLQIMSDLPLTWSLYVDYPLLLPNLGVKEPERVRFAGHPSHMHLLKPLLSHPDIIKTGSRISAYDFFICNNVGIEILDPIHDTINMDWLADENRAHRHGLKEAFLDYYGLRMTSFRSVTGSLDVRTWPFEKMLDYGSMDAFASVKLHQVLVERLKNTQLGNGMTGYQFYTRVLVPYQKVLRDMTLRGLPINQERLESVEVPLREQLAGIHAWFNKQWVKKQAETDLWYELKSGTKAKKAAVLSAINLSSTQQLRHLFHTILKKPVLKKNVGKVSGESNAALDESVLTEYADDGCPYAEKILEYRKIEKLLGTYVRGKAGGGIIPKLRDGRVHSSFYLGTVTGRLASADPNLQNIPAKGAIAKQIRQCFEAPKGYKLLVADYRQVEMLLFAHFSKDPVMLAAANGGQDFHCMTGATMYGKTYDEMLIAKLKDDKNAEKLQKMGVTDLTMTEEDHSLLFLRSLTKAINFG